jgi:predicted ATPase
MTQEELAERSGVSIRTISDIERGISRYPRRDTLQLLSAALELSDDETALLRPARYTHAPSLALANAATPDRPTDATPLIGRATELHAARVALTDDPGRLVTLTGPGGIGKTRLALELIAEVPADSGGATFVDLAPVTSAAYVSTAIAHALGLRERAGQPLAETLHAELADKRLLLVLDNFEHLLPARNLLRDLRDRCPNLRLLATSRHPLEISGERVITIPPLDTPDPRQPTAPDAALNAPAPALFIVRAKAVQPRFAATPVTARTIARICARLGGVPLAIELAAAWSDRLSPQEILLQLRPNNARSILTLLTRRGASDNARQSSMRDAVAWSYHLLDGREQVVFRRLGIFAGGWSAEAAEVICGPAQTENDMEALSQLTDHSLIFPIPTGDGSARFSMHSVIAAYAQTLLDERKERAALARRHAEYFTNLVERLEQELTGAQQRQSLLRLTDEYENIRAALRWTREHQELDLGLRLAGALWWFWETRGYVTEGREWIEGMLALAEQAGHTARDESLARALYCATVLAAGRHDFAHAEQFGAQFLQKADQPAMRARALVTLGNVAKFRGDQMEASRRYTDGLALLRELNDIRGTLVALNNLSALLIETGDLDHALPLIEESLTLKRQVGDRRGVAVSLMNLGEIQKLQANWSTAQQTLEEGLRIFQELNDRQGAALALSNLGELAYAQGDDTQAIERFNASLAIYQQMEDATGEAQTRQLLGRAYAHLGDVSRAETELRASANAFAAQSQPGDELTSLLALADSAWTAGDRLLAAKALSDIRRRLNRTTGARVALSPTTQAEYERLLAQVEDAEIDAKEREEA